MGDFDFLAGSWNVERPAQEATRGSDDWDVHPGTTTCHRVLGDVGTADEIIFPGYSLRLFDTEHGRWASYRANSRTRLRYPPVFGTFAGGRGDFTATASTRQAGAGSPHVVGHHGHVGPLAAGVLGRRRALD
ncbi:MAG: hypothetical protein V7603_6115 [Micromonosporaceae bacterium]